MEPSVLLRKYPSSRVLIAICDPVVWYFRRYRHCLLRTIFTRAFEEKQSLWQLQSFLQTNDLSAPPKVRGAPLQERTPKRTLKGHG